MKEGTVLLTFVKMKELQSCESPGTIAFQCYIPEYCTYHGMMMLSIFSVACVIVSQLQPVLLFRTSFEIL
jgi:hypothetical protein